ncbi:MAG: LysE family translocator [Alphaproteobacteria bacterium]|nr:LysE family translocator [Alphaproteobacteria bacterium]
MELFLTVVAPMAAFTFAGTMTPGPNNVMLAASGANFGFRRTTQHMIGVGAGASFLLFVVALGMGAVFAALPALQLAIKIAGAAFLIYLAWRIATAVPAALGSDIGKPLRFIEAFGFQFANPKAWTITAGAASTFMPPSISAASGAAVLAATFAIVAVPSIVLWTAFGVGIGRLLTTTRAHRIFNGAMALLLVAAVVFLFAV